MSNQMVDAVVDGSPALYVITVDGLLDPDWSPRLGGMQIVRIETSQQPKTQLTGWMRDQGALHGVLATLNSLSMPIVGVERVRSGPQ